MMDFAHGQEASAVDDAVLYVEELAGPDDYWLSITDAARVCRVQDVSIRRAINRKSLPVRRQRAGQNKRTRFVRASDLERAGFPIIDESAMITTEIGKVDVLSIPRQQQQIVQEHQALLLALEELRETLVTVQRATNDTLCKQEERWRVELLHMQETNNLQLARTQDELLRHQEQLQQVFTESAQNLASTQQRLGRELERVQIDIKARSEQAQAVNESLRYDLTQVQAAAYQRAEDLQATLTTLQATLRVYKSETDQQLIHLEAIQQKALVAHQQTIGASLQQSQQHLLEIEQRMNGDVQTLSQRFSGLEQTLAQIQQSYERDRQKIAERDQETSRQLQHQQRLLDQHEQLMPLLPYAHQHLLVKQDWLQELHALEERLLQAQQRELERYQPILPLLNRLSPERLEALARWLDKEEPGPAQKS